MANSVLDQLQQRLERARGADRPRLKKRLDGLRGRDGEAARAKLAAAIERSVAERERREGLIPTRLNWPDLPVVHHREELAEAIRRHQVVVVAGETGSGKTTQLPKICLQLGRGVNGYIGHTQPRRLAARSVAARLAEELHSQVGALVGYKVRFSEQVSENSLIKLMTDGMLLSEVQNDRFLHRYDTLIIDEAHERSLNIDFLLGYLKQLLPRRPDLKVIITSATIDHRRFAEHFADAPVFEVSGRTFPVDIRYRPPEGERELGQQVEDLLREIQAEERRSGAPGARDVLVFLSGERDIRDVHHHLKRCEFRDTELLPLYARLSAAEQQRVFSAHRGRRVVLSTNVAETSLTVPGIRYVIDAGTARVSRYSVHSKVQRLPVEPVSQASANQRAGRSGRLMPGICYRLYGEDDFLNRPAFTDPEIQRTNLAAVILQMADLRLGRVEDFPFMEPPDGRFIRDGYRLLEELGALDSQRQPTVLGRQLARFPLDPTLARMVVAGAGKQCLREILVIVAALAVQDPRERPREKQQQADQAHQPFESKESDFLFFWNLWCWAEEQREALTRNQYEKLLKKHFLAPSRMREWRDTHRQLLLLAREEGWTLNPEEAGYEPVHRALLTGLLGNVMTRDEEGEWLSTRNRKPLIWPGSALRKTKTRWLMAAEQVETSRLFARAVARVEPQWIEAEAAHLIKRQYSEPHWSKRRGCVMAKEQVNLFGLVLAAGRRVNYGPLDPPLARELMIREGLVAGHLSQEPEFVKANRERLESLEMIEHKLRRRDILVDEEARVAFYDERLPEGLYSLAHLRTWYRKRADPAQRAALLMDDDFLLSRSADIREDAFPDHLRFGALTLPLEYSFDPTGEQDGVTLVVPVAALAQVEEERLAWLVPGLLREKLEALIRALPKARRRRFVPVPDYVNALMDIPRMETLQPDQPLLAALTRELQRMTGVRVEQEEWPEAQLAEHLRINLRVVDEHGATLAEGRDINALRQRFSEQSVARQPSEQPPQQEEREWRFGTLPVSDEREQGGLRLRYYPALEDRGDRVALVRFSDAAEAARAHGYGVARLMLLRLAEQARQLRRFAGQQPGFQKLKAEKSAMARQALEQALLRATSEHFHLHDEPPRSEHDFQQRLDASRGDFVPAAEALLAGWAAMFADYRGVMARLEKNFPLAWAHAHRDIKTQLAALFEDDFLLTTPMQWLREYRRYLAAISQRLEKLPGQLGRDRTVSAELEEYWQRYLRRAGDAPPWRRSEPLTLFRWMLEEYRVSLFAQTLGTRMPVSAKRLNRQWEAC